MSKRSHVSGPAVPGRIEGVPSEGASAPVPEARPTKVARLTTGPNHGTEDGLRREANPRANNGVISSQATSEEGEDLTVSGSHGEQQQPDEAPLQQTSDPPNPPPSAQHASTRPLSQTKRAAQNRAAQRAFRERRDKYIKDLELKSHQIDAAIGAAQEAQARYVGALQMVEALKADNDALRVAIHALGGTAPGPAPLVPEWMTAARKAAAAAAAAAASASEAAPAATAPTPTKSVASAASIGSGTAVERVGADAPLFAAGLTPTAGATTEEAPDVALELARQPAQAAPIPSPNDTHTLIQRAAKQAAAAAAAAQQQEQRQADAAAPRAGIPTQAIRGAASSSRERTTAGANAAGTGGGVVVSGGAAGRSRARAAYVTAEEEEVRREAGVVSSPEPRETARRDGGGRGDGGGQVEPSVRGEVERRTMALRGTPIRDAHEQLQGLSAVAAAAAAAAAAHAKAEAQFRAATAAEGAVDGGRVEHPSQAQRNPPP